MLSVSSMCVAEGEQQAMMRDREEPPRESMSSLRGAEGAWAGGGELQWSEVGRHVARLRCCSGAAHAKQRGCMIAAQHSTVQGRATAGVQRRAGRAHLVSLESR